jgi:hypothetical protein
MMQQRLDAQLRRPILPRLCLLLPGTRARSVWGCGLRRKPKDKRRHCRVGRRRLGSWRGAAREFGARETALCEGGRGRVVVVVRAGGGGLVLPRQRGRCGRGRGRGGGRGRRRRSRGLACRKCLRRKHFCWTGRGSSSRGGGGRFLVNRLGSRLAVRRCFQRRVYRHCRSFGKRKPKGIWKNTTLSSFSARHEAEAACRRKRDDGRLPSLGAAGHGRWGNFSHPQKTQYAVQCG